MSDAFLGEIKIISFNFPPKGWAFCNGQLLPINQNQALFSILGTTYGGNGQTTYALPNLQTRSPIHVGNGFTLGQAGGETAHTVTVSEMPAHTHAVVAANVAATTNTPDNAKVFAQSAGSGGSPVAPFPANMYNTAANNTLAPASVTNIGGSQPHNNQSPYLVLNFIICLVGLFPSQN